MPTYQTETGLVVQTGIAPSDREKETWWGFKGTTPGEWQTSYDVIMYAPSADPVSHPTSLIRCGNEAEVLSSMGFPGAEGLTFLSELPQVIPYAAGLIKIDGIDLTQLCYTPLNKCV